MGGGQMAMHWGPGDRGPLGGKVELHFRKNHTSTYHYGLFTVYAKWQVRWHCYYLGSCFPENTMCMDGSEHECAWVGT